MWVFPYLIGAFVSLLAGLAIGWLSGSVGLGIVASVVVFLVSAHIVRDRRGHGDEATRLHARDAAVYSQASHGGGHLDGSGEDSTAEAVVATEAKVSDAP